MIFCKKGKSFSDQIFCCCCCTFGSQKPLFSHQPNFQDVSKKLWFGFLPCFFPPFTIRYSDMPIVEQGCQILPLEFLLNTTKNNCTAPSILPKKKKNCNQANQFPGETLKAFLFNITAIWVINSTNFDADVRSVQILARWRSKTPAGNTILLHRAWCEN